MLSIGIPKETAAGETRVAATPDSLRRLLGEGVEVVVEAGAGEAAGFRDADYEAAGARVADAAAVWSCPVVCKVRRPALAELEGAAEGVLVVGLLEPHRDEGLFERLAALRASAIAMERIPRITRAQGMDALSSQANIAGYRAVIEAAAALQRFFPMMMTAAGSARPARVVVLGAGVAGLQAIATARRLGAVVEAFDVRPEVAEQVQSLGASFIDIRLEEDAHGEGGYARELSADSQQRLRDALGERLLDADVVISTALVPGRRAPLLIEAKTVERMRRGAVIVDLAAASGGNCELTRADEIVRVGDVTILGPTNLPARLATDASQFYARNVANLMGLLLHREDGDASLVLDTGDAIVDAALVVHEGDIRHAPTS
ncbi:Re/Si-specific NAD(P)(+) transhydrogenase subunit alpha [Inmirania thermothiophila]|uniref:NAD(P) transhydrogenase subunit alpha part 1 n=1 Tax=Inmirania thermothiophila TaxID=1750597 RepID=A0A3N1Y0E0_9GAMM|nr:Re/Si-specific NAD(P)(+) transhydrogenase subunit alpha [Inmirania thermothiophila]ROR31978.1 NAD(P) transhydrogenase subunit alpha [Inmirania thermothiophila]